MSFLRDWKRLLAIVFTGVVGLIVLLDSAGLQDAQGTPLLGPPAFLLVSWAATLTALALLIGLLNVAGSHIGRVVRRESDWIYSVILLLGMFTVVLVGILGGGDITSQQGLAEQPVRLLFRTVYEPLASSLLALLAFFSLSAALRALSQRRAEAWVIVGVALVVLLSQLTPVAALPLVGDTMQLINNYIVLAGARGLLIGVALGTIVASMRVLLGFDLPYLDR
jgi:hypothetical protein